MSVYKKPIIEKIVLVNGETIKEAKIQIEAQKIPGFIAIESQDTEEATDFISLSSISSMTISNRELMRTAPAHYFMPEMKVKVER